MTLLAPLPALKTCGRTKLVSEQANIDVQLLNLYAADNGTTVTAEQEASFDDFVHGHESGCAK